MENNKLPDWILIKQKLDKQVEEEEDGIQER